MHADGASSIAATGLCLTQCRFRLRLRVFLFLPDIEMIDVCTGHTTVIVGPKSLGQGPGDFGPTMTVGTPMEENTHECDNELHHRQTDRPHWRRGARRRSQPPDRRCAAGAPEPGLLAALRAGGARSTPVAAAGRRRRAALWRGVPAAGQEICAARLSADPLRLQPGQLPDGTRYILAPAITPITPTPSRHQRRRCCTR